MSNINEDVVVNVKTVELIAMKSKEYVEELKAELFDHIDIPKVDIEVTNPSQRITEVEVVIKNSTRNANNRIEMKSSNAVEKNLREMALRGTQKLNVVFLI